MKAIITIDMDGAAFGGDGYTSAFELAARLRRLASQLDSGEPLGDSMILDTNGNTCGRFEIVD